MKNISFSHKKCIYFTNKRLLKKMWGRKDLLRFLKEDSYAHQSCIYIYIYAFSRGFYPKRLTVHSGYIFVLSVCVFPAVGMVTLLRMEGIIIVILCALFCNVFSTVNET